MMNVIARLRELVEVVEFFADDWSTEWYPSLQNRVPDALLTTRPIKLRSAVLARVEAAGAALSLEHALKRMYRDMRTSLASIFRLETPLLAALKEKQRGAGIRWGGAYFDVVTGALVSSASKPFTRSRFWRDPFVTA